MIAPMIRYTFLLYHKEYGVFMEKLQELGLVDISISNIEPDQYQREILSRIDSYKKAVSTLRQMEHDGIKPTIDFVNRRHAFESYDSASAKRDELFIEIAKTENELENLKPWGDFDVSLIDKLKQGGVNIHFYSLFHKEYEAFRKEWGKKYMIKVISRDTLSTYFIIVAHNDATYDIQADELSPPDSTYSKKQAEYKELKKKFDYESGVMASCIPYIDEFISERKKLEGELHLEKAIRSGTEEADGKIILLEGWIPAEKQGELDKLLDETGTFHLKKIALEGEDAPILLKNNKFFSMFENIGNFYALPKYGTTDLTPYYGPFYALFFGFCLGDAGYGLLFIIAGIVMALKLDPKWKGIGWLAAFCGLGAVIFGILTGNVFGIQLAGLPSFEGMSKYFIDTDGLFNLALALGFIHIIFAMIVRIVSTSQRVGLKYALGPLGWLIVIVASLAAFILPNYEVNFNFSSTPYYVLVGAGLFLMLFLNRPGKNPLINFGGGLWNTYNDITGLLSDVLSYIRLFALCLSGGVLALVFNDLAVGLSPDIPVLRQICMVLILAIGHGINLFMATLSSFVHPMRLTFVEFYKNAGFEPGKRAYDPLKKEAVK